MIVIFSLYNILPNRCYDSFSFQKRLQKISAKGNRKKVNILCLHWLAYLSQRNKAYLKFFKQISRPNILGRLGFGLGCFTSLETQSFLKFTRSVIPPTQENEMYVYIHKVLDRLRETQIIWFRKRNRNQMHIMLSNAHGIFVHLKTMLILMLKSCDSLNIYCFYINEET